jgi:hypothetical protein
MIMILLKVFENKAIRHMWLVANRLDNADIYKMRQ